MLLVHHLQWQLLARVVLPAGKDDEEEHHDEHMDPAEVARRLRA